MRTEQNILNDLEKLGWYCTRNNENKLTLRFSDAYPCTIWIDKNEKDYHSNTCIDMDEHKLLNELFTIWEWF